MLLFSKRFFVDVPQGLPSRQNRRIKTTIQKYVLSVSKIVAGWRVYQLNGFNTNIHRPLNGIKPFFSGEMLKRFELSREGYTCQYSDRRIESVDLSMVKGTMHGDYYEHSWDDLLPTNPNDFKHLDYWKRMGNAGVLKRGWSCVENMKNNPSYYIDNTVKDHWSFYKVGNDYFISEGNHRTVMAAFFLAANQLPTVVHGVAVTEVTYQMDPRLLNSLQRPQGFMAKLFRRIFRGS